MSTNSSMRQFIRLLGYLRGRRVEFTLAMILILLMSYTSGIIPVLIRDAVDRGVTTRDYEAAIYFGILILFVAVLNGVFSLLGRLLLVKSSQHVVYRLRIDAFNSILRQGLEFFGKTLTGQLISRITNDAERITGFLSFRLRMLVYSSFLIVVSIYYMIGMSSLLTLIAVLTIVGSLTINILYARRIRPVYNTIRHQTGVIASISASTIGGIKTVKSLAAEGYAMNKFQGENTRLYDLNIIATRISAIYGNSPFLVIGAAMSAMLYYGGRAIVGGTLTVGELIAFLTYMLTLTWPLRALGFIIGDIQRSLAAATRLFEVIDSAPASLEEKDSVDIESPRGEIIVENVWFSYHTGRTVLKDLSIRVKPGEKILVMGPPGSGKSTLLKLIAGLYKPDKGKILIDGVPINKIKKDTLRRIIAYVPQEPFIFNRSIKDNIALWDPTINIEDIIRAARIAKIHDFINSLPEGYDTIVGEKGITLSGGQRQRIAIARALVRDPQILLLDDPVSNLDAETEEAIIRDLEDVLRNRTAIIVSQRPSLARIVDRVVILVDGRIVEEGPPDLLLSRKGVFNELLAAMRG